MEKRRVRLEINGVVCGLITEESDAYMEALAKEVGDAMGRILSASPFITREAAAVTAALGYLDDAKKNGRKVLALQERIDELEVEAEIWQEEKVALENAAPNPQEKEKTARLEAENTALVAEVQSLRSLADKVPGLEDENQALREQLENASVKAKAAPQSQLAFFPSSPKNDPPPKESPRETPLESKEPSRKKKRKNPLRFEEEFEQEGFVSFFEKDE